VKLVQESEWMRIFSNGKDQLHYKSKFLTNEVQVSADDVKRRWDKMSPEQQLEFAIAFSAKPTWSADDSEILDHLAKVGNEYVIQAIADLIAEHFERKPAEAFFLKRVKTGGLAKSNYFRILRNLGDREAVPQLFSSYQAYQERLVGTKSMTAGEPQDWIDYLNCCAALSAIDGGAEFVAAIRSAQTHTDPRIRKCAQNLLRESYV